MAAASIPGPLGLGLNHPAIDPETSAVTASPLPVSIGMGSGAATPVADKTTAVSDSAIEALDLAATARTAAYALKKAHPAVEFTSGRRSKEDQARAMAGNVVDNRKWIEQTYASSTLRTQCQEWVDATTEIYTPLHTLSLHDALPIYCLAAASVHRHGFRRGHPRRRQDECRQRDRKSTRLNSSHYGLSRMPSSA